jgi:lysophospholipase L1-like esterase
MRTWALLALALLSSTAHASLRKHSLSLRLDRRSRLGGSVPAPLYYAGGPFGSATNFTNPITTEASYCVSIKLTPQNTTTFWTTSGFKGLWQIGTTNDTANTLSAYRNSTTSLSNFVFKFRNSANTLITTASTSCSQTDGSCNFRMSNGQQATVCVIPTAIEMWLDGQLLTTTAADTTSGNWTIPTTMYQGSLNPSFSYGVGLSELCISGPKTAPTGSDAQGKVNNSCAQFTRKDTGPCLGCISPSTIAANATKVLALGDSITAHGSNEGVPRHYPDKLQALMGTSWRITNGGLHGDSTSGAKSRYDSTYRGQGFSYAVVEIGTNDLANGTSAATIWTTMSALFDEIRTDGLTLIPVTILPRNNTGGWTAGKQTELTTLNTDITNYCTTYSLNCVDAYAGLSNTPTDATVLKPAWDSGDHLHPNQDGLDQLATLVRAALP